MRHPCKSQSSQCLTHAPHCQSLQISPGEICATFVKAGNFPRPQSSPAPVLSLPGSMAVLSPALPAARLCNHCDDCTPRTQWKTRHRGPTGSGPGTSTDRAPVPTSSPGVRTTLILSSSGRRGWGRGRCGGPVGSAGPAECETHSAVRRIRAEECARHNRIGGGAMGACRRRELWGTATWGQKVVQNTFSKSVPGPLKQMVLGCFQSFSTHFCPCRFPEKR